MKYCKVFVIVAVLMTAGGSVWAQSYPMDGKVFLSFEPDSRVRTKSVNPGESFEFYVIVDVGSGRNMAGLEGSITLPTGVTVTNVAWPSSAIDLGPSFPIPEGINFIVGLGACFDTSVGLLPLATITAVLQGEVSDAELLVTPPLGAANPSSFAGEGAGWVDCPAFELYLFEPELNGSGIVLNPTVSTQDKTWGAIKAMYTPELGP